MLAKYATHFHLRTKQITQKSVQFAARKNMKMHKFKKHSRKYKSYENDRAACAYDVVRRTSTSNVRTRTY